MTVDPAELCDELDIIRGEDGLRIFAGRLYRQFQEIKKAFLKGRPFSLGREADTGGSSLAMMSRLLICRRSARDGAV